MLRVRACAAAAALCLLQDAPLDGSWELTRIFRPGAAPATRPIPVDSTVYLRVTLESHQGGWISGRLYRRYRGAEEHAKIEGGLLRGPGPSRYILGADLERPASAKARTAAWLVGDTLRLGTSFVPDADSLELRRVAPDAPYPATVLEVVTPR